MMFGRRRAAAVATSALLLAAGACTDGDVVRGAPDARIAADDESTEIDPLANDPAAVESERVTITARVDDLVHPNAFRIDAADPNGDRYLVLHDGATEPIRGDRVRISGRVENLDMFELEEELGADLEMPTFELYEGDYGIVAEKVRVLP